MMRFLSLTQPWATLMAIGAKRIETRSWATQYRGWVGIHAAKGFPGWARETCLDPPFAEVLVEDRIQSPDELLRGHVLAVVYLSDVIPTERVMMRTMMTGRELVFGDYSPGRFAWLTDSRVQLAHPIPAKGRLGLWYDADLAERVWRGLQWPTEPSHA